MQELKAGRKPLALDKATPIALDKSGIQLNKGYRAQIQLGSSTSWRSYKGGSWKMESKEEGGQENWVHTPAIHITDPISGATLAGLCVQHNQFVLDNKNRTQAEGTDSTASSSYRPAVKRPVDGMFLGDVRRQFLVLGFEETDDAVKERSDSIEERIEKAVTSAFKGLADEMKLFFQEMMASLKK